MKRAVNSTQDRWQVWFWRLVQFVGVLIVLYEVVIEHRERPWIDLTALAMILGAQGVIMALRVVSRVAANVEAKAEEVVKAVDDEMG